MIRRDFLKTTLVTVGAASLPRATRAQPPGVSPPDALIDTNVHLSRWPLRRVPADETSALVAKLRSHGVTQAWAGTFDALLHRDLAAANARLATECEGYGEGLLVPFGSVNPRLPSWEDDVRRCAEEHRMPGLRLYPAYHGYKLDDPGFVRLLRLSAERGLLVQLVLVMEDRRMMHPLLQVDPPDVKPLAAIVRQIPNLRLVLLNSAPVIRGAALLDILQAGEVAVDIAMLEGVGGVRQLITQVSAPRIVFGSHAPLFYFEAALLKLQESQLTAAEQLALRAGNAQRLLAKRQV